MPMAATETKQRHWGPTRTDPTACASLCRKEALGTPREGEHAKKVGVQSQGMRLAEERLLPIHAWSSVPMSTSLTYSRALRSRSFRLLALAIVWSLHTAGCGDDERHGGTGNQGGNQAIAGNGGGPIAGNGGSPIAGNGGGPIAGNGGGPIAGSAGGPGTGTAGTGEPVESGEPDRPSSGSVSIAEAQLRGTVSSGRVALRIPVSAVGDERAVGSLRITLGSVDESQQIAEAEADYDIAAGSADVLTAELELPSGLESQADLAPWNVRIEDGNTNGVRVTRSLLYVIPPYEVRLEGPADVRKGKPASYRVQTRDALSFAPLADYPVNLKVARDEAVVADLSETSDDTGVAIFDVVLDDPGSYEISAGAEAEATAATVEDTLQVTEAAGKVLLTTDKPIYQPGQTIHLRTLALVPPGNEPLADEPVLLEVEDGKGNKIMKRTLTSNAFGIAATSFQLGQVLNMGTFAVRATARGSTTQKSVDVARYALPKFRSSVTTDRGWYSPGETAEGVLQADYFFGKPVANAEVVLEALTLDIGETLFTRVQGRTDAEGRWSFSLNLPSSVAGLPLEQGLALINLRATVIDGAGQEVTQEKIVPVAARPLQLSIVPEGGQLVPGVDNTLLVFVSDPMGSPLGGVGIELATQDGELASLTTDEYGQARITWTPPTTGASTISATVTPETGEPLNESFDFSAQPGGEHVMVRTDRAVYRTGESVAVEVVSSANSAFAYVDWLNDGQVVAMRTLEVSDGQAAFETPVDATLLGTNRVEAYIVDDDGNIVRSGRTFFVKGSASLDIRMSLDKDIYGPGESATLTFSVADTEGRPAVAALGLQVVDEAIYSLIESRPGLLETHFQLEEAYSQPHYQIRPPALNVVDALLAPPSEEAGAAQAQQERAAGVLAAMNPGSNAGVTATSWPGVITRAKSLLAEPMGVAHDTLVSVLGPPAVEEQTALEASGCAPSDYYCNGEYYPTLLFERLVARLTLTDFWGNAYSWTQGSGANVLQLTSAGPDEAANTADDLSIAFTYEELGLETPTASWDDADGFPMPGNVGGVGGASAGMGGATGGPVSEDPTGEGEARVRKDFPETLYVNPAIITDTDGTASVEVPLADSITEWRVTALANTLNGGLGSMEGGMTVFQDFFVDIDFPATLTRGDEIFFPVAVYNYLDTEQTVELQLEPADWYTALGATAASVTLAPAQVTGVRFPVRVEEVGAGTLTVRGIGAARSDAVARTVRVVPDGRGVPVTRSGALKPGELSIPVSFPESAVPGSEQLVLNVYPAYLSQVVEGMDSMLREPTGCFEQTTSATWPNVLVLDYMRETGQITPEIQMRAESLVSTGYQRLLTFEHPGGGYSWFGTQDGAPYLSVTAFGLMEFVDMARVAEVDAAMIERTRNWLVSQQASDGSWEGDQTEFFSFHTSTVRNTAFVLWALASAGATESSLSSAVTYVAENLNLETDDGYTLAMAANALAIAAPNEPLLSELLERLDAIKHVDGDEVSWDSGDTQTTFYSYGADAAMTTTALVAHAMLLAGGYNETVTGALAYLAGNKDSLGNFGSTQATIWSLRTLLLASQRGTETATGTLEISVDGERFTTVELTEAQGDVMTTVELGPYATTGEHQVDLEFVGTGRVSYNLIAAHNEPWTESPAAMGPLGVSIAYDKTQLYLNETAVATVTLDNLTATTTNMVLVTLGIPPGFAVVTDDLQEHLDAGTLSHFEMTGRQLNLYLTQMAPSESLALSYRVQATMPVRAADGGAVIYPYYEPDQRTTAPSTTLEVLEPQG